MNTLPPNPPAVSISPTPHDYARATIPGVLLKATHDAPIWGAMAIVGILAIRGQLSAEQALIGILSILGIKSYPRPVPQIGSGLVMLAVISIAVGLVSSCAAPGTPTISVPALPVPTLCLTLDRAPDAGSRDAGIVRDAAVLVE